MVSGNTQPNSLEQQLDTPCSGACCSMPCQRRLLSRRDARGVKNNLVPRLFALLYIFQPPTPATDPPFPLLCVEKMTILSFAVPPSSPAPYSSRPGTASKTAAPLGPTARTTTDRRAQPFSLPDSCGGHRRPPGRLMTARHREAAYGHAEHLKRAPLPRPPPPSRKEASSSRSHSSGSSASSSLPDSSRNDFTLRLARRTSTAAAGDGTSLARPRRCCCSCSWRPRSDRTLITPFRTFIRPFHLPPPRYSSPPFFCCFFPF
jgi:hypothetical protein